MRNRSLSPVLALLAVLVTTLSSGLALASTAAPAMAASVSAKPGAPAVKVASVGPRSVRVSWQRPVVRGPKVTGYRVSRVLVGSPRSAKSVVVKAARRSVTFTGLSRARYTFSVAAVSRAGTGPAGRVTRSLALGSAAAAETAVAPQITGSSVASERVSITWSAPQASSPITGYRVSRDGTDLEGKGAWATTVPADTRTFTMTLLRNDQPYTVSVAAITSAGQGPAASIRLTPTAKPSAPVISGSSVGDHTMTVSWTPPVRTGSTAITGYRVARDGTDTEGRGPWSTVLPATSRTFTMTLLRNDVQYTFAVAAVNAAGLGAAATVPLTPRATTSTPPDSPTTGSRPVVVQSAVGEPATLRKGGATGPRLRMAGVCVWGVPDSVTEGGAFGLNQYRDRARIVATAKAWGANHIRLRVLADDYNNNRQGLSKAQRLQMIKDWRDTATAAGLYFYVTWWDSLDGYAQDGNWPTRYGSAFQMMTDVHRTLGNDDRVFYEPFNEPNSFGDQWNAWGNAMRATVTHWRSIGYRGVLLIDTPVWSHAYDDNAMSALERHDAAQAGMGGKHQLVWAKHDYANEGWPDGGNTFSPTKWRNDTGGAQRDHVIWETEFGNYNGDPSTVHLSWSQQASRFFADELDNTARPNFAGATPFVWGPWWDANALTAADNTTPTAWGRAVRDGLLARAKPTWP